MKLNPCRVCGKQPYIYSGGDIHCYNDLHTHAIECRGPNAEAIWNRLNFEQAPEPKSHLFSFLWRFRNQLRK